MMQDRVDSSCFWFLFAVIYDYSITHNFSYVLSSLLAFNPNSRAIISQDRRLNLVGGGTIPVDPFVEHFFEEYAEINDETTCHSEPEQIMSRPIFAVTLLPTPRRRVFPLPRTFDETCRNVELWEVQLISTAKTKVFQL